MSSNKSDNVVKYLAIAGTLGLSYFLINFLSKPKGPSSLSLERTRKALQQIKYQMYANCISFAQGVNTKLKAKYPENELNKYLRGEVAKLYEAKEALIIDKYGVSKEEYSASLQKYSGDQLIKKNINEILQMMEKAIQGIIPDMKVHPDASKLLSNDQVRQVYKDMCQLIAVKVWEKLDQNKKNNPNFNSKDDSHFKKAIRELTIYDLKIQFLQKKGFRKEWGCPNEVFFKVMENLKQANPTFKAQSTLIEKAYERIIEKVSNSPQDLTPQIIKNDMDNFIANASQNPVQPVNVGPLSRSQPISAPKPQPQQQNLFSSARAKPAQKPKEDDEFDMEKLMMEELLKRSQQPEPVVAPVVVEPKIQVQNIKPEAVEVKTEVVEIKPQVTEIQPQVIAQIVADKKEEQIQNAAEQKAESIELKANVNETEVQNTQEKVVVIQQAKVETEIQVKAQSEAEVKIEQVIKTQELALTKDNEIVKEEPVIVQESIKIEESAEVVVVEENPVEAEVKENISEPVEQAQSAEVNQQQKIQTEPITEETGVVEENKEQ